MKISISEDEEKKLKDQKRIERKQKRIQRKKNVMDKHSSYEDDTSFFESIMLFPGLSNILYGVLWLLLAFAILYFSGNVVAIGIIVWGGLQIFIGILKVISGIFSSFT